jgi:hypothetical protein
MKDETPPRRREGGTNVGFSVEFVTTSVTLMGEEKCIVIVKLKKVDFSNRVVQQVSKSVNHFQYK